MDEENVESCLSKLIKSLEDAKEEARLKAIEEENGERQMNVDQNSYTKNLSRCIVNFGRQVSWFNEGIRWACRMVDLGYQGSMHVLRGVNVSWGTSLTCDPKG
ncbi:hypothetical protein OSB04_030465 [Centaurea solstitialis]|uniref:Uncharacterized protein n=1 Tax=Centaurea solstitialis TaxID=347529 RepID=A0AA38SR57_9ASTR|nr:hypothetical protein OSB04_030465 [Centaurea solstitialis]